MATYSPELVCNVKRNSAAGTLDDDDRERLSFVRVNVPKQGVSILKLKDLDVTVGEILAMVQKKRALPVGQHGLELVTEPGAELSPDVKLKDLGTCELLLIHKYSMWRQLRAEPPVGAISSTVAF